MGLQYVCQACGRRLTVPEELYASKIRGRMVTVKCKGCGAPVGIDGTVPPPAPAPSDSNAAPKPDELVDNSGTVVAPSESSAEEATNDEPEMNAFAIDASWETTSDDEDSSRFSHVNGPIPIRLPTARIGRYALFDQFAEGGIATVHFGRIDGAGGFSRIVAIKRLLPHLVKNDEFTEMLLKEARLAARVRHPNVVPTLDVVASQGDVLLILEYVHGESLSALCRTQAKFVKDHLPVDIAVAVMLDVLSGLCAVHEATDEKGRLLGLVHRDISPPNVVVGADGYSRVLDFGIAKALEHIDESMPNRLKGKIGYMAPEQIRGERASQRSDVFAAGVILWELLATRRLFVSSVESDRMKQIVSGDYPRLSRYRPGLSRQLEQVTKRALAVDPNDRFANSREFADALEQAALRASARRVAQWVSDLAAKTLSDRARMMAQVENWNPGPEIPLNSSPFAGDNQLSKSSAPPTVTSTPPPAVTTTSPPEVEAKERKSQSVAPPSAIVKGKQNKAVTNAPWLLLLSCVILALALYYALGH